MSKTKDNKGSKFPINIILLHLIESNPLGRFDETIILNKDLVYISQSKESSLDRESIKQQKLAKKLSVINQSTLLPLQIDFNGSHETMQDTANYFQLMPKYEVSEISTSPHKLQIYPK